MNTIFKTLAESIGVKEDLFSPLTNEEVKPEDIQSVGKQIAEIIQHRTASELVPKVKEETQTEAYASTIKKSARMVNKTLNLGLTSDEVNNMNLEDVLGLVNARMEDLSKNSSTEVSAKLEELQNKYVSTVETYENKLKDTESKYESLIAEAQNKLTDYKLNQIFSAEFKKIKYGVPQTQIAIFEREIKDKILERYDVNDDGTIFMKGGGAAMNFSDNGKYERLSEPILELAAELDILKKSGGDSNSSGQPPSFSASGGNQTQNTKAPGWSGIKL